MKFKSGNRWKNSSQKMRYKKWRTGVFQLNKGRVGLNRWYVCEKCNKKRKTTRVLHAHHIFSWNKYSKLRYDKSNGVVLCKYCHDGFHYKYKFEALDNPKLLLKYITGDKYKKIIREYINVNKNIIQTK